MEPTAQAKPDLAEKKPAKTWINQLDLAEDEDRDFVKRGEKIVERYKDVRPATANEGNERRYNILWSNVRTIVPACYSQRPNVIVERRHKDSDPVALVASAILERSLTYDIENYPDFDNGLRNAILDRFLPGRGVNWVRYEQTYTKEPAQITDDEEGAPDDAEAPEGAQPNVVTDVDHECCPSDYVFWKDFRYSPARNWEEVTWVARRVYMSRAKGTKRFGDKFKEVPLEHTPKGVTDDKYQPSEIEDMKKAKVWEIWDKDTKTAIWVAEGYAHILDELPDPLELEGFFPCPKPLFATQSTDSLVPVADYIQYQDQASELDDLTNRIHKLVKACRVVGVYAGSSTAVKRLLDEGVDNQLIPVDNWMEHAEKGGLSKMVDWLPLDMVIHALDQLYKAEQEVKAKIYEITGLSDIIRGASEASETATAQKIKANYAGLRLKETQGDIARFATDILRRKAQIMASFYRDETLIQMSGILLTPEGKMPEPPPPQPGMPPMPPPEGYPPQVQAALDLIRNEPLSCYRIEVAADSLVELDMEEEKRSRMEFLEAAGGFLAQAIPAAQQSPELMPLFTQMLLFGVRGFKAGRDLEAVFDETFTKMQKKQDAAAAQPPKPSPEEMKMQADQAKAQAEAQKSQQEGAIETQRLQMEGQAQAHAQKIEEMRLQMEQNSLMIESQAAEAQRRHEEILAGVADGFARWKTELEMATRIETAEIAATKAMDPAVDAAADAEITREIT
jgi:hypothetical protein